MSKDRDWLDYANTAVNIHQASQTARIGGALETLQRAHAANSLKQETENHFREMLFQVEGILEESIQYLEIRPAHVFSTATLLKSGLQGGGFGSERFSDFSDKDRVRTFFKRLDAALADSRKLMSDAENGEYVECAGFLREVAALDVAIQKGSKIREFREKQRSVGAELETAKRRFGELEKRCQSAGNWFILPFLGAAATMILFLVKVDDWSPKEQFLAVGTFLAFVIYSFVVRQWTGFARNSKKLAQLKTEIRLLASEGEAIDVELQDPLVRQVTSEMLEKTRDELVTIKRHRQERMDACIEAPKSTLGKT